MVTKPSKRPFAYAMCLNLAKIHMVTKPGLPPPDTASRLNLAKIHMVTKPQTYFNICI